MLQYLKIIFKQAKYEINLIISYISAFNKYNK